MAPKKTTKEFVREAIKVHGDKYIYSESEYKGAKENVIIKCKSHGNFEIRATNHLQGRGCKKCQYDKVSLTLTKTKDEFISEAIKVHGDKYIYSESEYSGCHENIQIICKIHGAFLQTPASHLKGCGCQACSIITRTNKNTKTLDVFVLQSMQIHNGIYRYEQSVYVNDSTKLLIECKIHGTFEQTPSQHLQGHGCKKCANDLIGINRRLTFEIFLEKAKKIHGDKFDYSQSNYKSVDSKVFIICILHNSKYEQIPWSHLLGHNGCSICNKSKKYSNKQIKWLCFIEKMYNINIQHAINGNEYTILKTNYKADGYCKETNTIYEFQGDFWHGNPKKYSSDDINKITKCTFGVLYEKTMQKEKTIKELGYNLVVMWESDWNKINKSIRCLQRNFRNI
jgi:hypothetical protein